MKPLTVFAAMLVLACVLPGCLENPLYDDDCCYEPAPPADNSTSPGPPEVRAAATMVSANFVSGQGGTMTLSVWARNARGVETAYDIQVEIILADGWTQIGGMYIAFGDLDANQWAETSVDVPISAFPGSVSITLNLTWWDLNDNLYQRHINGSSLLKTAPEG